MPRVSVLLPTHYRADVIGFAIRSVLSQTMGDFELLVVGDGAEAGTAEVVTGFGDPRIRWFDLPKAPGFGYANRNRVLEQSRGDLIAFIADDDLLFPDHLERLAGCFDDLAIQIAYSRGLHVMSDGFAGPAFINLTQPDQLARYRTQGGLAASCFMYRASAFGTRAVWPDMLKGGDRRLWLAVIDRHTPAALAYLRDPSLLHFVAGRLKPTLAKSVVMHSLRGLPGREAWWPTILAPALPPGKTEQQAYFEAMQDPGWSGAMRRAVTDVSDRVAFDRLRRPTLTARLRRRLGRLLGRAA